MRGHIFLAPDVWRRYMRDHADWAGWSRSRMRAELRKAGHTMDPWKVPLPVIQPWMEGQDPMELFLRDGPIFGLDQEVDQKSEAGGE